MTETQKISWKRLAVEAAAIVASILLAFAIDAWWENRQDRADELLILRALKAEFQENAQVLPLFIRSHSNAAASAAALIEGLRKVDQKSLAVVRDSDVLFVTTHSSFDPSSGAFDAMLQSGTLRFVQNPAVRETLASWPGTVEEATENEYQLRTIWGPRLNEILMRQVDFALLEDLWDCYDPDTGKVCSKNEVKLEPTLELIGHLVHVKGWIDEAVRELKLVEKAALDIVQQLEQELAEQ